MSKLRRCPCLCPEEDEVTVLDYRHCSLEHVPSDVFAFERTLEELYIDANTIRELPRELFYCHGLCKLTLSDNEVTSVPPAIASLINLQHIDISKNGIVDLPENIKSCQQLAVIEASVNPMGKLPEGFTQLLNLTELYLNDTFLDYLPGCFGRVNKLRILELRENHLKTLPRSLSHLLLLERLDVGNNEFAELPDVVGGLPSLQELWCDSNQLTALPKELGQLKNLMFLDASKNRIESLPPEMEGCISLADMHLSTNLLQQLPETIGRLSNLTTLKVDDNRLTALPYSIGGLVSLSEMNISANDIDQLPPSIGLLRHLRTLYADENFLMEIPPEMGSCSGLTVLSLRGNNLTYIPDELGRIPRLRVLNLSDNKLCSLPFSFTRLQELQALWLAENQTKPLIKLQSEIDSDTGQRVLTCYLLPQQPRDDREEFYSEADADSFHPSMWEEERQKRQQIQFDFPDVPNKQSRLERTPTPYPKEMKHRIQHMRNLALKQLKLPNDENCHKRSSTSTVATENGNQPVVGRRDSPERWRSPKQAGVTNVSPMKATSPLLTERHHLLKADKEKMQKDKSRMGKQHSRSADGQGKKKRASTEGTSGHTPDDDGGFLSTDTRQISASANEIGGGLALHNSKFPPNCSDGRLTVFAKNTSLPNNQLHQAEAQWAAELGLSYNDFLKGLGIKGATIGADPLRERSSQLSSDAVYNAYHKYKTGRLSCGHGKHLRHRPWSGRLHRDYESDVGARASGNESEVSYRSESAGAFNARTASGYTRVWGAVGHSWLCSRSSLQADGYMSDSGYQWHHQMPRSQLLKSEQPSSSNADNIPDTDINSFCSPSKKDTQYSNQPISKRTTISNDKLYEPQVSASALSSTPSKKKSATDCLSPGAASRHNLMHQKCSPSYSPSTISNMSDSFLGHNTPTSRDNFHEPTARSLSSKESKQREPEDDYKHQLQSAAVRMQKSPAIDASLSHKESSTCMWTSSGLQSHSPASAYSSHQKAQSDSNHSTKAATQPTSAISKQCLNNSASSSENQKRPNSLSLAGAEQAQTPSRHKKATSAVGAMNASGLLMMSQQMHPPNHQLQHSAARESPHAEQSTTTHNNSHEGASPAGISNYEKDVAVYKQQEPISQVSSSTDSGYGHAHIFDHANTDTTSRLSALSAGSLTSPGLHSAACPATSSSPGTPYSNVASPEPSAVSSPVFAARQTLSSHRSSLNIPASSSVFKATITKNPGLGFSIAGGLGSAGNPFRPEDAGIFITKVQADGPAVSTLQPSDKILQVNGVDFTQVHHSQAVDVLRNSSHSVSMIIERHS